MTFRAGIFFLLFWLLPIIGNTQVATNNKFQLEYLSTQSASDLLLDDRGFLWANSIPLLANLYRYDGYQMQAFSGEAAPPYQLAIPKAFTHSFLKLLPQKEQIISVSIPTQSLLLLDPISFKHQHFSLDSLGVVGIIKQVVTHPGGGVAILTLKELTAYIYHWKDNKLIRSFSFPVTQSFQYAQVLAEAHQIWISTHIGNSYRFDWKGNLLKEYDFEDFPYQTNSKRLTKNVFFEQIRQFNNGDIYVSIRWLRPSLYRYDAAKDRFESLPNILDKDFVPTPIADNKGNLLFAYGSFSQEKNALLKKRDGTLIDYSGIIRERTNAIVSDDLTKAIYASNGEGILKIEFLPHKVNKITWEGYSIRGILEISPDSFLIGNDDYNWLLYHPKTNKLNGIRLSNGQYPFAYNTFCRGFAKDRQGKYWSNDEQALYRFDLQTGARDTFLCPTNIDQSWLQLTSGEICLALSDTTIRIFHPRQQEFTTLSLDYTFDIVNAMLEDSNQEQLWLGTDNGLIYYNLKTKKSGRYTIVDGLKSKEIHALYLDKLNRLWIGTSQGVAVLDIKTQKIINTIETKHGLTHATVVSIFEDNGQYWLATLNGISIYNPATKTCRNLSVTDGFNNNQFNTHAVCQASNGAILLGTKSGLNYFYPATFKSEVAPELMITNIDYYEEATAQITRIIPAASKPKRIHLPAINKYLHLNLTLSVFENKNYHRYAYRLKNQDTTWIELGNQHEITFSSLPKGNYDLEIKGATQHSHWSNPITIPISAKAFFYETWWFYSTCLLVVSTLIFVWVNRLRSEKARLEVIVRQRTAQIEQDKTIIAQQAEELQTLDKMKSRFFANISHEFRTPLTIIQGFARESAKKIEQLKPIQFLRNLKIIQQNSEQLLRLVTQLLDLSKLEVGEMKVNFVQGDVLPILTYAYACFESLAAQKNVELIWQTEAEVINMDYDQDKLLKIIFNLLSNALKFTPSEGQIIVRIQQAETKTIEQALIFEVKDTGIGIAPEKLAFIFNRFYQADDKHTRENEGVGIGLAYVKELVTILKGVIKAESQLGKGTSFRVSLPIHQNASKVANFIQKEAVSNPFFIPRNKEVLIESSKENKLQLLIIEDNPAIIAYLRLCLSEKYQISQAENGILGIEKAMATIPDLIICDVMMPEKNGFEVCDSLKKEERTSHIPIIMLTALADTVNKVNALQKGADAYLSKPFHPEELHAQIQNLLLNRQKLQSFFQKNNNLSQAPLLTLQAPEILNQAIETNFLLKVQTNIQQELANGDLNGDFIARQLFMSRTQFYRKMKALTDQPVSIYIRNYRLHQAKALLEKGNEPIKQIAYQVGITNTKYFSRQFSETFGLTPSAYRKSFTS